MRILMRDNKGSITVEMCFIMPIVIGIIMMLILLILKGLNDGVSLGATQLMVYGYNEMDGEDYSSSDWEKLQDEIVLDKVKGDFVVGDNEISATVTSYEGEELCSVSNIGCKREWDRCTDRLRRWQLYGDVLYE